MATPTQYSISHKELVTLIIKHLNIHDGRWVLSLTFGLSPGNFGPSDDQVLPGIAIGVNPIMIERERPGLTAPSALVVDAAIVNPSPKKKG
jgi:hypothetical protein